MNKILTLLLLCSMLFTSCAKSKTLTINGKAVTVKPYGWANSEAQKNDKVIYQVSVGNVVWSIIGFETVIVPVWLTGWELFEPVRVREGSK